MENVNLEFGYANGVQTVCLPKENLLDVLLPNKVQAALTGRDEVRRALAEPIAAPRLREVVRPGEKIAVITSDITRPMPTAEVMPALLEELAAAGVADEDITLVFALGSHRPHTQEEMQKLAGPVAYARIRCVDSSPEGCVHFGVTGAGTPVDIDPVVAKANRRICLANIEYHYFAGYSGGSKSIMPGCSTRAAIQNNHRLMVDPRACVGQLVGNPLREDVEEAAAMVGIDYILNVVLDEHKQILHAVAGHPVQAHR